MRSTSVFGCRLLNQPAGSITRHLRLTVQGEMIQQCLGADCGIFRKQKSKLPLLSCLACWNDCFARHFMNPEVAEHTLERYAVAWTNQALRLAEFCWGVHFF